jgi:two-component system OmpR family response regulator
MWLGGAHGALSPRKKTGRAPSDTLRGLKPHRICGIADEMKTAWQNREVAHREPASDTGHGGAPSFAPIGKALMTKVLLIEDDDETAAEIAAELVHRGFDVERAATGTEGLDKARSCRPDVMIVDRLLPEVDGLTIVDALRQEQVRTPVLILSAIGAVDDRVRGLRIGGDDYLTKPFTIDELLARIGVLLRRPIEAREPILRVGPLELDLIKRTAKRGERAIDLLPREFRLLEYMMQHNDQLLTRAMLLEEVWSYKFVPATNLVDVHMGRLRHKVDMPNEAPMINSVRDAGFVLRAAS